jgi:hypothetical protein
MSLDAITPDSVGRGGTAIGDAIRAARALVGAGNEENESLAADIYLLTDGEDHETRPLEAAQEAGQSGLRIIAIGLGSDTGAPVPADPDAPALTGRSNPRDGYMLYGGERVQSRMNAAALRSLTEATPGGAFLDVGTGNLELDRVYRLLRRAGEMKQLESTESVRYTEVFQLPLAAAVFLGVASMFFDGVYLRRTKRVRGGAALAAIVLLVAGFASPARAQSLQDDLQSGNRLLQLEKPGEALSLLEGASIRHPDSASIALARGCAQVAMNQPEEAEASFRRAERLAISADEATAARARFNLGLLDSARGAALAQSDAKAALKSLEQAERWFRNARPGLAGKERTAAAANIEALQRAREALRQEIAKQESQEQKQQQQSQSQSGQSGKSGDGQNGDSDQPSGPQQPQQNQEQQQPSPEQKAAEDLANLARQQDEAASASQKAEQQQGQSQQQRQQKADELAEQQSKLSEQAEKLDEQLAKQQAEAKARESQQGEPPSEQPQDGGEGKQSENLARSRDKLDEARRAQARAEEQLRQGDTKSAEQSQREAAEKLKDAARSALGIDQQQPGEGEPQEQEPSEQQAQENQRAFDATAASILDREARQLEAIRRFLKAQQRTRTPPVEKDW